MVSTPGRKQGKNGRNLKAIRLEKRRRCEKYLKELLAKKGKREYTLHPKTPQEYEYEYEPDLPCSAWQDYLNCFYEESESDQSIKNHIDEKSNETTVSKSQDFDTPAKVKYNQYEKLLVADNGVKIKEEKLDCVKLSTNIPEDTSEIEETDFEWSDSEINNLFTTVKQIDESDSKEEDEEDDEDPIMEEDLAFNFKHSKRKKFEYRSYLSPFEVKFVLNETANPKKSCRTDLRSNNLGVECKSYYQKHRRKKNLGPRPFQCSLCGARFMTKSNLKAHSEIVHSEERNHECEDCGLKFKTKYHLKTHCMNIHRKYKSLTAATNENRYPKRERMKVSEKLSLTCSLCGVVLNNRRLLNMHMVVAHTKKCPKNSNMKSHQSTGKPNSSRRAYNLRETVDYNQPVKRIVRRPPSPSEEIRIFDCNDCSAFYSSKCLLKNHILENHLFYHCEVSNCGLVFKKKANLQRHNHRVHSKITLNEKVARKKMKKKNFHHRRGRPKSSTTASAPKFECDYCKVKFAYKKVLLRHILQYHPSESESNNSNVSYTSNFTPKIKRQTPGRPLDPTISQRRHKCNKCPMAFKTRSHLQAHDLQRHSEERRFVCPFCNAKFKMNGILKTHMLRLHGS
ncbi:unnamed protein product [Bemisia tabaci]|uniref:C2H2-type domain-containing protein n=1 Tax=Bemisia tabaci TaxID=7038 RepID=A0A9P0A6Y9_BEMTA|nr:unnamed protein product [Bemisia tabaci]